VIILSSNQFPGLPIGVFPAGFSNRNFFAFLIPHFLPISSIQYNFFGFITLTMCGVENKVWTSHYVIFSSTLLLSSSMVQISYSALRLINAKRKVLHTHRIRTITTIISYIFNLKFSNNRRETPKSTSCLYENSVRGHSLEELEPQGYVSSAGFNSQENGRLTR
jgi:hypothetical protein